MIATGADASAWVRAADLVARALGFVHMNMGAGRA